ncbi:MAG: Ig-like domain-containing protein, partial [Myxococcota bacterium]|nr:Ig-like domain-containing protein [Myxococcota bacterium]
ATGLRDATTDGSAALFDASLDGALRLAWAEDARRLGYDGVVHLDAVTPGRLGLRLAVGRAELVAANADPALAVRGLPFTPRRADGACALALRDGVPWVELGRERRVVLHAATGNARPAADPGPDRAAPSGSWLALDGRASCDADGDVLAPRWELVAAPPGSSWRLDDADTWNPKLEVDRPGPYRVRLVVTDANGAASRPADVVVHGGPPCANRLDDDLDGLFDEDDPDCDVPAAPNRPPRADDDTYAMAAGETLEADSVLANDDDPDIGDARVAVLESPPARGSLWLRPDGRFRYEPAAGFAGIDAFRYRARDAAGAESAPARVEIEVRGPDVVSVFLVGGLSAFHHAPLESGDLEIERRPDGGVAAITGVGVLAGGSTSLEFSLAVSEPEPLAMADGTVTLRDPALGLQPVVVPIAGQPLAGLHPNGAVGWSGWIAQPPLQPYALLFAVHDRD